MEAINVETMRIVAVQDVDRQIVDGLPWPSSSFIIAIIIIGILIIRHSHSSLLSYKHHHQESSTKNIGLICRKWLQLWIFTKRMTLTMHVKSSAPSVTILVLIVQEMPVLLRQRSNSSASPPAPCLSVSLPPLNGSTVSDFWNSSSLFSDAGQTVCKPLARNEKKISTDQGTTLNDFSKKTKT